MTGTPARRIVLLGAGGHAREVASCIEDLAASGESIELLGYIDERIAPGPRGPSRVLGDFSVIGKLLERETGRLGYITAVGDNALRRRFVAKAESSGVMGWEAFDLRHPLSHIDEGSSVGPGTYLAPFSSITAGTSVGAHCILNVHASVAHDCEVGDYCNLNPGVTVCGNVRLGPGSYIGAGATVIDGIEIGAETIVGAGAVVTEDLPARCTAVGVPARITRKHGAG